MDSPTTPADTIRPSILVPHAALWPSTTNPRTRFNEDSLKELAASMVPPVGIIEPLVVRPLPTDHAAHTHVKGGGALYEIVAGERRWRAAKMAGIIDVPVIVRTLTDAQVLDLQLIENKHRDDIHPLEEARAMERRIKLDRQLTAKGMAKFIGVSERYVQNRLRYLTLTTDAQKIFLNGDITAGHADLLIRLSPDDQKRALKDGLYADEWNGKVRTKELRSVRDLDSWIADFIRITPTDAAQTGLFPDLAAEVAEGHDPATLIEICDNYEYHPKKGEKPPYPLGSGRWSDAEGKACDYQQRAVMVMGRGQGRVLTVCTGHGKCRVHFPYSLPQPKTTTSSHSPARHTPAPKSRMEIERQQWLDIQKPVTAALVKAAKAAKPTPKTIAYLGLCVGGGPHVKTFGEVVAATLEVYSLSEARQVAKALDVDLTPLLKSAPKKPAPAKKKPTAKRAAKKPAAKKGGKKR